MSLPSSRVPGLGGPCSLPTEAASQWTSGAPPGDFITSSVQGLWVPSPPPPPRPPGCPQLTLLLLPGHRRPGRLPRSRPARSGAVLCLLTGPRRPGPVPLASGSTPLPCPPSDSPPGGGGSCLRGTCGRPLLCLGPSRPSRGHPLSSLAHVSPSHSRCPGHPCLAARGSHPRSAWDPRTIPLPRCGGRGWPARLQGPARPPPPRRPLSSLLHTSLLRPLPSRLGAFAHLSPRPSPLQPSELRSLCALSLPGAPPLLRHASGAPRCPCDCSVLGAHPWARQVRLRHGHPAPGPGWHGEDPGEWTFGQWLASVSVTVNILGFAALSLRPSCPTCQCSQKAA